MSVVVEDKGLIIVARLLAWLVAARAHPPVQRETTVLIPVHNEPQRAQRITRIGARDLLGFDGGAPSPGVVAVALVRRGVSARAVGSLTPHQCVITGGSAAVEADRDGLARLQLAEEHGRGAGA